VESLYLDNKSTINGNLKGIDGIPTIVESNKTIGELTILKGFYKNSKKNVYVVFKGEFSAHGNSIREAKNDLEFKILSKNFNVDDLVNKIKKENKVTINDYRLLTGACSSGVNNFLNENNVNVEEMSLNEAIELTNGAYGSERFKQLIGWN
jgi:hypothetical protein